MPKDCSLCAEGAKAEHSCSKCRGEWCKSCNAKMGKCPFCREVYNEKMAEKLAKEMIGEYNAAMDEPLSSVEVVLLAFILLR